MKKTKLKPIVSGDKLSVSPGVMSAPQKVQFTFSPAEVRHLLWLIGRNEECCEYYGNEEHHWGRSKRLRNKLETFKN